MFTTLGKIALIGIVAILLVALIAAATGCQVAAALDEGLATRINPDTSRLPAPVDTPLAQFILGGLGSLFAVALAVYIHRVSRKSAKKKDLKDHHEHYHPNQN